MSFRAPAKFEIFYDRELVNKVKKGISDFLFGPVGAQTRYQKRKILKRKDFSAKNQSLVLKKQRNLCADCGLNYPKLKFHHIDGNRSNNDISNCVALCPNCHDLRDRRKLSLKNLKKLPTFFPRIIPTLPKKLPKLEAPKKKSLSKKEIDEALKTLKELNFDNL